jgi:sugar/nucleoside kinase (ribokinase family)
MFLCIGQIVADIVVRPVDGLPAGGTTVGVQQLQVVAGGCAANTACVLAKLGSPTALAGLVGQDSIATAILADIASCGVDVSHVAHSQSTPTSAVIVAVASDGQRSFLYRNGGNEALGPGHVPDSLLAQARHVHIGGGLKLLSLDLGEVFARARKAGCTTSLDTDWDSNGNWRRRLEPAMEHLDYLFTNEEEGAMLTGRHDAGNIARALLDGGARAVVVKRGAKGSLLLTADGPREFDPYEVRVVDTTCAGDTFVAGFLHALGAGWDLDRCMHLGNAAGALCTTAISHLAVTSLDAVEHLGRHQPSRQ